MRYILYTAIALLTTLSACQPEETDEPQTEILCQNFQPDYVYANNGDTARCWVPNSFTPNQNGINEFFCAYGYNIQYGGSMVVRDGSVIVYQNDTIIGNNHYGWDGKINGQKSPRKNYYYAITGTDVFGHSFTLNGEVSVIDSIGITGITWTDVKVNCDTCTFGAQWDGRMYNSTMPPNEFFVGGECLE